MLFGHLSVCLWRNVCLSLQHIFYLGCLWYGSAWAACIFWSLSPCCSLCLKIFSPIVWIFFSFCLWFPLGFPGGSDGKESACNAGDPGSVPGSGRAPGEGNGNPLQYSCLENSMDREAWSIGLQKVGHDWATNTQIHVCVCVCVCVCIYDICM